MEVLPELVHYERLSDEHLIERILAQKQRMGSGLVILGHHYQRAAITKLSDFVGDSFGLSQKAAHSSAQNIVFCGVRFMAESAAILCQPGQKVYHPDPDAGCPMADMANMDQVRAAWSALSASGGAQKVIPVTYMNSTAELKAFCGHNGGIVCTSSNAQKTFEWAFERGEKIFFFPDEHLGRNTAKKLGLSGGDVVVWDPKKENGGVASADLAGAKIVVWAGHCPVHMEFKARDIKHVRQYYPGCSVVVHPECEKEVVDLADAAGSTDFIVKYVESRPPRSITFVGTEVNLITRLQKMFPDRQVFKLQRSLCLTMYQITLANLCFTLEHLAGLETVQLSDETKMGAWTALDRMLALP